MYQIMPDINVLIKPASGMCNIRCRYCFYRDEAQNREIESYGFMSCETLEQVIKKTIDYSDAVCTIAYQGGEPTLRGLEFFRKSMEYQRLYNSRGIKIINAIQTNGIGLDDEWAKFLKDNKFLVGISLDGTSYTHDSFRVDAKGNGTFHTVMESISLLEKYNVDYNILTVVNALTAKKANKIYEFYKQEGYEYLQFIPCLNPLGKGQERLPHSLTPKLYSQFLKTLFDLWYNDFEQGKIVHIQQFEGYVKLLLHMHPEVCGMSGICSYQHVVEADGEVYPCDFFVLDEYKLGNLNQVSYDEINRKRREIQFVEKSAIVQEDCLQCKYYALCRSGCQRHRNPKNIFCMAYYDFFEYTYKRLGKVAEWYIRNYS